ncbi:23S rRNA (uracil(1939)-C(5))-methyltransferase, partial [Leptospira borgpetersenii serovar Balcanica]|nr:23S rRNA (uracil(1939)-C(5))-methyltransferase [Leptospira borgpetersenii serovar Balcanica]
MQPTDTTNNTSSLADNTTDNSSLAAAPSKKLSKPSSRVRRRLKDAAPLPFKIDGLSHDGRGVAIYGNGFGTDEGHIEEKHGKKVFVSFALPNESVNVRLTNSRKSFE